MKNNRFFVSKKIIEYNTGKEDVVRKIQALIDGDVKSYELSIGVYSRYDGYVNDDGFVLYPKSNRSIYHYTVIQGKFITDEKKVDLEFYCKDDIIAHFVVFNVIPSIALIFGLMMHQYSMLIMFGFETLFINLFMIWCCKSSNAYRSDYDVLKYLIKYWHFV
jgi:hypothetical protein